MSGALYLEDGESCDSTYASLRKLKNDEPTSSTSVVANGQLIEEEGCVNNHSHFLKRKRRHGDSERHLSDDTLHNRNQNGSRDFDKSQTTKWQSRIPNVRTISDMDQIPHLKKGQRFLRAIGTHHEKFHADEVMACAMLTMLKEFEGYEIIRTRRLDVLARCEIVVDVGRKYDHSKRRYDHHQQSFEHSMTTLYDISQLHAPTKLSSAGLIYAHYGRRLIAELAKEPYDSLLVGTLYRRIYLEIIEEIDAKDNHVFSRLRNSRSIGLSRRVANFNYKYREDDDNDARFKEALQFCKNEFMEGFEYMAYKWWPSRLHVLAGWESRYEIHPSGQILQLPSGGVNWTTHLLAIEKRSKEEGAVKFIIFETPEDSWKVHAVPNRVDSKNSGFRALLPVKWRGASEEFISSDISGAFFVHPKGTLACCRTYMGALLMAISGLADTESESLNFDEPLPSAATFKRRLRSLSVT